MKIKHALQEYLLEIEVRKYTPKTIRSYRNNLNLFVRYLDDETDVLDTEDLTLATVRQFSAYMVKRGKKGRYVNGLLKTAKSFIQYCYDEGYGGFNTKKNFKWCKEEKVVIITFKPTHVRQMMSSCGGNDFLSVRDKAVLSTLFETGIRCWELCCIKPEDIHDDYIVITSGKNHKQRVVPITPILKKALMRYEAAKAIFFTLKPTDDYYFLSNHGRQLTNSAIIISSSTQAMFLYNFAIASYLLMNQAFIWL